MFFLYLLLSEGFATNPHDFYISEEVPLMTELEWDSGGKERIEEVITKIENGGKGRNYDLARRCKNY